MSFNTVTAVTPAFTGAGDAVFLSIDGGTNYIQVMATNNMQYDGQSIDFEEVSTTTSPSAVKEYIPTMENPGDFTFDVVFNPSDPGQQMISVAYASKKQLNIAHVYKTQPGFSQGPINSFVGWISKNPQPGSDVAKATKRAISIKISSVITKTPAVATV